jgi:hypothetical protein
VSLREVWPDEAKHFTPWLADNIDLLADELGIGVLSVKQREFAVGAYSLDILAETADGRRIAIENQLEASDHRHLGQCLTYASGVGAWAVVWLVARFCEEHRSALDWLNQNTNENVHFFGVEVSAVRISGSPAAPLFRVVVRPNEWERAVRQEATPSSRMQTLEEFLTAMEETQGVDARIAVQTIASHWIENPGAWLNFGVGSMYLILPRPDSDRGQIWPCGILTRGRVEFAFKPLSSRRPFDDDALREEFRRRINAVPGVSPIPADALTRYPTIRTQEVLSSSSLSAFLQVLDWFAGEVRGAGISPEEGAEDL